MVGVVKPHFVGYLADAMTSEKQILGTHNDKPADVVLGGLANGVA